MLGLVAFLFFVVLPVSAVAAVLVRWLEDAAKRADEDWRMKALTANATDIAMRIESLESYMLNRREPA